LREKEARGSTEDDDRVAVLAEFFRFGGDGFLLVDMDQPVGLEGFCGSVLGAGVIGERDSPENLADLAGLVQFGDVPAYGGG
jgi:hypothetical protein